MTDAALAVSIIAVGIAIFALLVSLGNAARLEHASSGVGHRVGAAGPLSAGAILDAPTLGRLVGEEVDDWLVGPSLLVFGESSCRGCHNLIRRLADVDLGVFQGRVLVADVGKPGESNLAADRSASVTRFVSGMASVAFHDFHISAMPQSFVISKGRIVVSSVGDNPHNLLDATTPSVLAQA